MPARREPKANPLPKLDGSLRVRSDFHLTLGPVPYSAEPRVQLWANESAYTPIVAEIQRLLMEVVKGIPAGSVMSYGDVGAVIGTSGRQVGRMMAQLEGDGVPWWRVCNATGEFPISKRNPMFENEQRQRLEAEGVPFLKSGRVDMGRARLGNSE